MFDAHPPCSKEFMLFTDPLFVDKVHDIVGLCLNTFGHVVALSVDEKSWVTSRLRVRRTDPGIRSPPLPDEPARGRRLARRSSCVT